MKSVFVVLILLLWLMSSSTSGNCTESSTGYFSANYHLWTRTSYNSTSFETMDYHLGYSPIEKIALELDWYYYLERKARLQRRLEEYSGQEQPFPYGLESFRAKLHFYDINIQKHWLTINKLTLGNFIYNRDRYEYLNFSRYVLHSPLDIEQKRSMADWGFYTDIQFWKINIESFLLHSFKKDRTAGFQVSLDFPLSPKIVLTPIVNGVFDRRTDESYNLQYPLGTDNTLSYGCDIKFNVNNSKLYVKPLFAHNRYELLDFSRSRNGYLRNTEVLLVTPSFFQIPLTKELLNKFGIHQWGIQLDGVIEKNDIDYRSNFAYDRDEINDDFYYRVHEIAITNTDESPGFLYNREFVNIRIGEMGGELGVRLQGFNLYDGESPCNLFNFGTKIALYSRIGEKHTQSHDDFWLAEADFRAFTRDISANIAFWRRRTNIVWDPDLNDLKMSTWIVGVHYILYKGILLNFKKHDTRDQIVFSAFFRTDNFIEKYEKESCKYRGSIFMAALYMPVIRYDKYLTTLQVLYRKYVPDNHIIARIYPPNNGIKVSLNISATW